MENKNYSQRSEQRLTNIQKASIGLFSLALLFGIKAGIVTDSQAQGPEFNYGDLVGFNSPIPLYPSPNNTAVWYDPFTYVPPNIEEVNFYQGTAVVVNTANIGLTNINGYRMVYPDQRIEVRGDDGSDGWTTSGQVSVNHERIGPIHQNETGGEFDELIR